MTFHDLRCLISILMIGVLHGPVTAQETQPEPPKVVTPANGSGIKFEGQVQFQGSTSTMDSVTNLDGELRRMRTTIDGDAGNGFGGRLMMDFDSNRARVRDAYAQYKVSPSVTLLGGQFKLPFNIIETASSKRLLLIERGNRIRGLRTPTTSNFLADAHYSARNRGFMGIFKLADRFTLSAGGWLGSGEAGEDNDGKEAAARLEYSALPLPDKRSKPLILGVAAVTNGFFGSPRDTLRVVSGDTLLIDDPRYGAAFEGSVEYGAYAVPGFHVAANVVTGDSPTALSASGGEVDFETFLGLQGWAEFLVETSGALLTAVGPAFRADRFDPNTDAHEDGNVFLTPGLNLYFGPNFKAQLNYDVLIPQADAVDTESAFRFQTQVLF